MIAIEPSSDQIEGPRGSGRSSRRLGWPVLIVIGVITAALVVPLAATDTRAAASSTRVSPPDRIAIGQEHTCAVTPEGGVDCWGANQYGELGTVAVTSSATPIAVPLAPAWRAIGVAVGLSHSCALLADGEIACWGRDSVGQLGVSGGVQGPAPVLVELPSDRTATLITAMDSHTCAILDEGSVVCWGPQYFGELGQPTNVVVYETPQSVLMPAGGTAVDLSTGPNHTCAVLDTGRITCWGDNVNGQFGDGTTNPSASTGQPSTPILLDGGIRAIRITTGYEFTCAVGETGHVSCWGRNDEGQLGDGTLIARLNPGPLSPVPTARVLDVDSGVSHSCARLDSGETICWGYNALGSLGNGTEIRRQSSPTTVLLDAGDVSKEVVAGGDSTCAVLTDGRFSCWGSNSSGQLGDGTRTRTPLPVTPQTFSSGSRIADVAVGGNFTCILDTTGRIWCWGGNFYGQLGRSMTSLRELDISDPIPLPNGARAVAMALGPAHICVLLETGEVSCWGNDGEGRLGTGVAQGRDTPSDPILLAGTGRATAIAAGGRHTCALLTDGQVTCWGDNEFGQLADGTTTDRFASQHLVALPGGIPAVSITAGHEHTCVVQADGAMACWGRNNFGQLGDATFVDRAGPVAVDIAPGTRARGIDAGRFHTCALLVAGTVGCWGDNTRGQLGTGVSNTSQSALAGTLNLPGGPPTQAIDLALGENHSCVLLDDGRASCWGYNAYGALGDGTQSDALSPTLVTAHPSGSRFRSLASGFLETCGLLDDGRPSCWGYNYNGQLGTGDTTIRLVPVDVELDPVPSAVTGSGGDGRVTLSWTDPVHPYEPRTWSIEGSLDGTSWWPATVSVTAPSATTVSGLTNDVAYWFRVTTSTPLASASAQTATSVTPRATVVAATPVPPPPPTASQPAWPPALIESITSRDPAELAAALSRHRFGENTAPVVHVALASRWVDSVAAGAAAVHASGPLLLVEPDALPTATATEIDRLGSKHVIVIGGPEAISSTVVAAIETIGDLRVTRLAGTDRYETAATTSQATYSPGVDTVYLVSGSSPVDGFAVARFGRPVLLSTARSLPATTRAEILRLAPRRIVVVGGTSAISVDVIEDLIATTDADVVRIAGRDRFDTAALIASHASDSSGMSTVVMVDGHDPAIPAVITQLGDRGSVLALLRPECVPVTTDDAMTLLRPSRVLMVGDRISIPRRC